LTTTWGYVGQYSAVALFGAGVGVGEIVSRYKDEPGRALTSFPGLLYVAINAAASAGALGLILTYGWKFGASGDAVTPTRLLIAGFAAMAFFRSSLFTVRVGSSDVGVGPATFLSLILAATDRGVDRKRAEERAKLIKDLMSDVSYEKAQEGLPAIASALMQNLDPADSAALGIQLEKIRQDPDLSEHAKSLALGLALATTVGADVLRATKDALGSEIVRDEPDRADETEPTLPDPDLQRRAKGRGLPATPQTPSDPQQGP
jgi:hypothetical protein